IALYDKENRYGIIVRPRYSTVFGNAGNYNGFANYLELGKVSGPLQFSFSNQLESAQYDPNDMGFLLAPNEFFNTGTVSYNIYQATKIFLNQSYTILVKQNYLFRPFSYQKTSFEASAFWLFKNFWDLKLSTDIAPRWQTDYFEMQ